MLNDLSIEMGCGASTPADGDMTGVNPPIKTEVSVTKDATITTVSGGADTSTLMSPDEAPENAEDEKAEREFMLEQLFDECDDDGSGALSVSEFSQLLDNKVDDEVKKLFAQVDNDVKDGKLTKEEFVSHHMQVFGALSYGQFKGVVEPMLKKAEETTVIDDAPAVVGEDDTPAAEPEPEPEPAAEEAAAPAPAEE